MGWICGGMWWLRLIWWGVDHGWFGWVRYCGEDCWFVAQRVGVMPGFRRRGRLRVAVGHLAAHLIQLRGIEGNAGPGLTWEEAEPGVAWGLWRTIRRGLRLMGTPRRVIRSTMRCVYGRAVSRLVRVGVRDGHELGAAAGCAAAG